MRATTAQATSVSGSTSRVSLYSVGVSSILKVFEVREGVNLGDKAIDLGKLDAKNGAHREASGWLTPRAGAPELPLRDETLNL